MIQNNNKINNLRRQIENQIRSPCQQSVTLTVKQHPKITRKQKKQKNDPVQSKLPKPTQGYNSLCYK